MKTEVIDLVPDGRHHHLPPCLGASLHLRIDLLH
jgi:hypothetical protein